MLDINYFLNALLAEGMATFSDSCLLKNVEAHSALTILLEEIIYHEIIYL
jgi:hypothetical protein